MHFARNDDILSGMFSLRLAWILGLVSTRDYDSKRRRSRFGPSAVEASDAALQRMERSLTEDRLALVLFLVGVVLLVYTWVNGPLFA